MNKIHAQFTRHGIKTAKESLGSKHALENLEIKRFSALEQFELTIIRDQVLSLTEALAKMDKEIESAAAKLEGYEGLSSIKGVGARSAAVLLTSIGNVSNFDNADKLAAYLGIVPKVNQSNDTDNRGRITQRGDKLARTILVQCTLVAIRYSGYLKSYYQRIKDRRGTGKRPSSPPRESCSPSSTTR